MASVRNKGESSPGIPNLVAISRADQLRLTIYQRNQRQNYHTYSLKL
jgi:hypothetical protein